MRQIFHKSSAFADGRQAVSNKDAAAFAQANFFRHLNEGPLIRKANELIYKIRVTLPNMTVSANDVWLFKAVIDSPKIRESAEKHHRSMLKWQKRALIHIPLCTISGILIAHLLPQNAQLFLAKITSVIFQSGAQLSDLEKAADPLIMGGIIGSGLAAIYLIVNDIVKTKRYAKSLQADIVDVLLPSND